MTQNGHSNPACGVLAVSQEMSAADESKSYISGKREFSFDLETEAVVLFEWLNSFDNSQQQQQPPQQQQPQCLLPLGVVGDERIYRPHLETTDDDEASSFGRGPFNEPLLKASNDFSASSVESLNPGREDELLGTQKTQPMQNPLGLENNSSEPATATAAAAAPAAAAVIDVNASGVAINWIARAVHSPDVENPSAWLERQKEKLNIKRNRTTDNVKNPKLIEELKARQKIMSRRTDSLQSAVNSNGQLYLSTSDFNRLHLWSGEAKQCAILDCDQNTSFPKQNQSKSDEICEDLIDNNIKYPQRSIVDVAIRSTILEYSRNDEIAPLTKISSGQSYRHPGDFVCRNAAEVRLNSIGCDSEVSPLSSKSTESPDSENSPATAVTTTTTTSSSSSSESCFFLPVFSPVSPVVLEAVKEKKRLKANRLLRPKQLPLEASRITRTPSLELQLKELEVLRELIDRQQKHFTEENQSSSEKFLSHSERPTVYSPQTSSNDDSAGSSVRRRKCEGGVSNQSHALPFQAASVSGMRPAHEFIPGDRRGKSEEDFIPIAARDLKLLVNERRQCRNIEANNYDAGREETRRLLGEEASGGGGGGGGAGGGGDQPREDVVASTTNDGQRQRQQLPLDRLMQQRATTQSQYADDVLHGTPIDNGNAQSQQHQQQHQQQQQQQQQQRLGHSSSSCASSSFSSSMTEQSSPCSSVSSTSSGKGGKTGISSSPQLVKCTNDSNKQWYRPNMTREDAIDFLTDKAEGSFVIRDSRTFAGHFALALKVSETTRNTATTSSGEDLVRHFLIESKPNGVRLKERNNEPLFPSLTAFVYQHCLIPLSLPHRLILSCHSPDEMSFESDVVLMRSSSKCIDPETISTTCVYIGSMDLELLTGQEALEKAAAYLECGSSPQTLVHFALSAEGILLTDTNRRVFFRRHFPLSSVSYCGRHSEEKRIFGFVSRRRARSVDGNECHLFADCETGFSADNVLDSIKRQIQSRSKQEI